MNQGTITEKEREIVKTSRGLISAREAAIKAATRVSARVISNKSTVMHERTEYRAARVAGNAPDRVSLSRGGDFFLSCGAPDRARLHATANSRQLRRAETRSENGKCKVEENGKDSRVALINIDRIAALITSRARAKEFN